MLPHVNRLTFGLEPENLSMQFALFRPDDFSAANPFVQDVLDTGIRIYQYRFANSCARLLRKSFHICLPKASLF